MAIDLGYDESGSGDTLLVSMQLGVTDQAKKMRRKWKKRLAKDGIDFFHSKEFGNYSYGVFSSLTRIERSQLLKDLGKLSRRHLYIGMTAKVTKSLYEKKTTPVFRSRWGTAYTFAIQMLTVGAYSFAEHMKMRPDFNIFIEDGHVNAVQALIALNDAKKARMAFAIPSRILSVALGSKSDHPILQSADMLGYSEWQRMTDGDKAIYNEMHAPSMRFEAEFLDFDDEMVDVVIQGAERWMADRKTCGKRKHEGIKSEIDREQNQFCTRLLTLVAGGRAEGAGDYFGGLGTRFFRRRSFASSNWFISATSSASFFGSCSTAACAQSSIHRSCFSCISARSIQTRKL